MSFLVAFTGSHTLVLLPFAPGSLNGLSERLMTSPHERASAVLCGEKR